MPPPSREPPDAPKARRTGQSLRSRRLVVPCQHGLHMRIAARIVSLSKTFQADIRLTSGSRSADAKSMISLMELGAIRGEALTLTTRGADAAKALAAITALFDDEAGLCRVMPPDEDSDD